MCFVCLLTNHFSTNKMCSDINTESEWRLQPAGLPVPQKLGGQ